MKVRSRSPLWIVLFLTRTSLALLNSTATQCLKCLIVIYKELITKARAAVVVYNDIIICHH